MSSETPVVQVKTLPMKYKCMHYALIAFISNHCDLNEESKEIMINKLPLYDNPQTQMEYYINLVDFKSVDTNIIKPMMKKKKEALKTKVAPKKKKTQKTTDTVIEQTPAESNLQAKEPAAVSTPTPVPAPKSKSVPKKKNTKKTTDTVIEQTPAESNLQAKEPAAVSTPTPVPAPKSKSVPKKKNTKKTTDTVIDQTTIESNLQAKEPTPIAEPTPKKKISRKKRETPMSPLTIAVPDDYPNMDNPTLEMKEEEYDECITKKLPTTPIMKPTPKTPRAPSKKTENQLLDSPTLNANLEDCLMIKHNEKRYWTLDEQLQNGPLFGDMTDEDGDPAPSSNQVGTIVNGKISLV